VKLHIAKPGSTAGDRWRGRLAAQVEPYVIIVPWALYKRANDHIVMLWMHRAAQATDPSKES